MKAFLLSNPYIEDCLKDHFNIYINQEINSLYLLNENHKDDLHNRITNGTQYKIIYVSAIEYILGNKDIALYVVFCDDLSEKSISELENTAIKSEKIIHVFSNGQSHNAISECFNKAEIEIIDTEPFSCCNNEDLSFPIYKTKPIIMICGLSPVNMQPKLELLLIEYFQKKQIKFDLLSYYLPFVENRIKCSFLDCNNIADLISELQDNNNMLIVVSLPADFAVSSPQDDYYINCLINRIRPDYTICCVNNYNKLIDRICDIKVWFNYKYNLKIDSFFVSDYTANRIEYYGENRPLHAHMCDSANCSIIFSDSNDSASKIIEDMMLKITLPDCVEII
jgi:hypothetical protein